MLHSSFDEPLPINHCGELPQFASLYYYSQVHLTLNVIKIEMKAQTGIQKTMTAEGDDIG